MNIIDPKQWIPIDGIHLEDAAEQVVRAEGNMLVIAGPGAGKTELLAQKAGFLFATNYCAYPRKILAISFKKDAADNLKKRIVKRYGNSVKDRFVSLTFDAFAKGILDRFRLSLPVGNIPDAEYIVNDEKIIDAAFRHEGYSPNSYERASVTKRFYEKTINEANLPLQGESLGAKVWNDLLTGFGTYKSCLSFQMISKLAIYIIQSNNLIKKAIQLTYSHVFLDEFQDTTDLQYELVKSCFLNSSCILTAVGDNKQRIMLWAGARRTVFNDFYNEFHAEGKRLIMNHRSAPKLVEVQKAMYEALRDTKGKVEASDQWNRDDGEVFLLISKNEDAERGWLIDSIKKQIENGTRPNDICVLCKQKPSDYTEELIRDLAYKDIRARIEVEYQDLLKEPVVVLIISVMKLAMDRKRPDEWEYVLEETSLLKGADSYSSEKDGYYEMQEELSDILDQCGSMMRVADD